MGNIIDPRQSLWAIMPLLLRKENIRNHNNTHTHKKKTLKKKNKLQQKNNVENIQKINFII